MLHLVKLIELKETEALDDLIILVLLTDGVKTRCYSIWKFNWKKEKKSLKSVELKNAPDFFFFFSSRDVYVDCHCYFSGA